MKRSVVFVFLGWVVFSLVLPHTIGNPVDASNDTITFQPNVIPQTTVSFKDSRFMFDWLGHHFEVAMYVEVENTEFEVEVEADKLKVKVKIADVEYEFESECAVITDTYASNITWGVLVSNVNATLANHTDAFTFKIEPLDFASNITVESLDTFADLGYNITRLHLPDNLVLSYEDLWTYNYSVVTDTMETKVKGVKGKSRWNLDPITYSSGIMTMVEFGSAGSWAGNLFWEFWNASDANGWAVAEKTGWGENTQFTFGCRLKIGNGTEAGDCFVYDENVQVYFNSSAVSANAQILIEVTAHSNLRLGQLDDETNKLTSKGVSIISYNTRTSIYIIDGLNSESTALFSSHLVSTNNRHNLRVNQIYNSIFNNIMIMGVSASGDIVRLVNTASDVGLYATGAEPLGRIDDVLVYKTTYGLYLYAIGVATTLTLENPKLRSITTSEVYSSSMAGTIYLINPDFDQWRFTWVSAIGEVYRQYSLNSPSPPLRTCPFQTRTSPSPTMGKVAAYMAHG